MIYRRSPRRIIRRAFLIWAYRIQFIEQRGFKIGVLSKTYSVEGRADAVIVEVEPLLTEFQSPSQTKCGSWEPGPFEQNSSTTKGMRPFTSRHQPRAMRPRCPVFGACGRAISIAVHSEGYRTKDEMLSGLDASDRTDGTRGRRQISEENLMAMVHREQHRSHRIGWLRAAVLGANDGICRRRVWSYASGCVHASRGNVLIAGAAGLVAARCRWRPENSFLSVPKRIPNTRTSSVKKKRSITDVEGETKEWAEFTSAAV